MFFLLTPEQQQVIRDSCTDTAAFDRVMHILHGQVDKRRTVLDKLFSAVLIFREDGQVVFANDPFYTLTGFRTGEVEGMHINDLWVAEDSHQHRRPRPNAPYSPNGNGPHTTEVTLWRRDGSQFVAQVRTMQLDGPLWIAAIDDLTRMRRDADALHQSEADLKALVDSTGIALLLVNPDNRIRKINSLAQELTRALFGIAARVGDRITDFVMPDMFNGFQANFAQALAGTPATVTHEVQFPNTPDKQIFEFCYYPVNGGDAPSGVCLTVQDISTRVRTERKLKQTSKKLSIYLEHAADALVVLDAEGRVAECNKKAALISGFHSVEDMRQGSIDEVLKRFEILDEEGREMPASEWPGAVSLRGEAFGPAVSRQRDRETGQEWWSLVSARPIFADDDSRRVESVVIVSTDITEMQRWQARYRGLVDSTTDMVYRTDREGVFTLVNPQAVAIVGKAPEDIINRMHFTDVVHPDYRADVLEFYQQQARQRQRETYHELPIITGSGETIWIGQNVQLVLEDGQPAGFQGIARDINRRKQVEEEREKLITELNAFAHTVAHDLKSPISNIIGYAEIALEDEGIKPITRRYLQRTISISDRMNRIVKELLRLAEVRTVADIEREPLHMPSLANEALQALSFLYDRRTIQVDISSQMPAALGVSSWVEEVWANYISNALKYSGDPPEIRIGGERVDQDFARFWVEDNGPGITPKDQSKLFREFSRVEKRYRARGHGLGLSIVRRIIERLGGEVGVESTPGEGSRFWFTLPTHHGAVKTERP
jgi:PAS domain S-box-containing protein